MASMTTKERGKLGVDLCTRCGDPISVVGSLNAEGICGPCEDRATLYEWGRRTTAAASLGQALDIALEVHTDDEVREMVEYHLEHGEGSLRDGRDFSPAEALVRTPADTERLLAEWAEEDPEKVRIFRENFERRAR